MLFNLETYLRSKRYYFGDAHKHQLIVLDRDKYDYTHAPVIGDIVELGFYQTACNKFNQPIIPTDINQFDLCLDWYKFKVCKYNFESQSTKLFDLTPLEKIKYPSNAPRLISEHEYARLSLKGLIRNRKLKQTAGGQTMKANMTQFPKLDLVDKLKLLFDAGSPVYLGIKNAHATDNLVMVCMRRNDLNQTEVLFKSDIPEISEVLSTIDINSHTNPFNSSVLKKYKELEVLSWFRSYTWFMRYVTGSTIYGLELDIRKTNCVSRLVYESNLPLTTNAESNSLCIIQPTVELLEGTGFVLSTQQLIQIETNIIQPMKKLKESKVSIKSNELDSKSKKAIRAAKKKEKRKIKTYSAFFKGLMPKLKPTMKQKQKLYFTDMGLQTNDKLLCIKNTKTNTIERMAKSIATESINSDASLVIVSKQEWKDWKRNKGIEPELCTTPKKAENITKLTKRAEEKARPKSGHKQQFTKTITVPYTTARKGEEQPLKSKILKVVTRNSHGISTIRHPFQSPSIQLHPIVTVNHVVDRKGLFKKKNLHTKEKQQSSFGTMETIERNIGTIETPIIVKLHKRKYPKLIRKAN